MPGAQIIGIIAQTIRGAVIIQRRGALAKIGVIPYRTSSIIIMITHGGIGAGFVASPGGVITIVVIGQ